MLKYKSKPLGNFDVLFTLMHYVICMDIDNLTELD